MLLEQAGLANGSSGRAPAFIETQYLLPDRVRMCVYGLELYERFERDHGLRFCHLGKLLLGRDEDLASFEQSVSLQESLGLCGARVLLPDELKRTAPQLRLDDFAGALWGPRDGYVDPAQLCRVYAAAAERHGARTMASTEVERVTLLNGGGFELETDRGRFACDTLVNATGAWSATIASELGIDIPVRGHRRQIARFELQPDLPSSLPLVVDPPAEPGQPVLYFREDGPSRILAGMHTESAAIGEAEDPETYARDGDAVFQASVARLLRERVSAVHGLRPAGGWAGLYPLSPDGEPILGEVAGIPGLFNAAALGGNGIQISAAVGRVIADLVLDGHTGLLPSLDPYRLERFAVA